MTRRAFLIRTGKLLLIPLAAILAVVAGVSIFPAPRDIGPVALARLVLLACAAFVGVTGPPMAAGAVGALLSARRARLAGGLAGALLMALVELAGLRDSGGRDFLVSGPMWWTMTATCGPIAFWAYLGYLGGQLVHQYRQGRSGGGAPPS